MARPIAWPSLKQRAGDGSGCCTVFIAIGAVRTARADELGSGRVSGARTLGVAALAARFARQRGRADELGAGRVSGARTLGVAALAARFARQRGRADELGSARVSGSGHSSANGMVKA